ncbi:GTPase IMAP family member 7-like isoform X1 [Labeo rohita]|uniref:GTPase IMAP family member 7-like isoform X1 n=1 Tax=Labeo rohita TaxID=84645 RepID=A0A498MAV0_LABRO|nr:GTPase IMAP family member 7-like isoform X1 [Labeo rohita]
MEPSPQLVRIVLLGSSVSENSLVGNFILGRAAFDSEAPLDVVERVAGRLKDRHVIIINSPQLLQTNISDHQITQTHTRATETNDILQKIIQKCANRHFSLQTSSSPHDLLQTLEDIEKMNDGRHLDCAEEGVKLNLVVCGSDETLKSSISEQILQQTDRRSDHAVDAPVLTLTSNLSSSDPCNFTCNGSNIIISFTYNSSCSPEEVTSDIYTLRLGCSDDFIMCNYSNPVSWNSDTKKVNELCPVNKGKHDEASAFPPWVIVIICLFTLALAAVIGFFIYTGKKGTQKNEQTIYAEVDENIKTLKSLEKSENPQTVYDTAKDPGQIDVTIHTTPNDEPVNQSSSLTEKSKSDAPVTVYSVIQQQPKPPKTKTDQTIYAEVNKPSAKYESAHPQSE